MSRSVGFILIASNDWEFWRKQASLMRSKPVDEEQDRWTLYLHSLLEARSASPLQPILSANSRDVIFKPIEDRSVFLPGLKYQIIQEEINVSKTISARMPAQSNSVEPLGRLWIFGRRTCRHSSASYWVLHILQKSSAEWGRDRIDPGSSA